MTSDLVKQNFELRQENIQLKKENRKLKQEIKSLSNNLSFANNRIRQLEKQIEDYEKEEEIRTKKLIESAISTVIDKLNKEHNEKLKKLNAKIMNLENKLNINSSNSGIPTSKQAIG